ncbi:class II aldolase/adducin family protein [Marinobacter sp. NP-6]|nr:class II aldolase/adducin family protein [Marinobacter sp. NP-6]
MPVLQHRVRIVSRALGRHDLVTAWGHCSARIDDHRFLVCAAKPMGLIGPGDDGVVVDINGPLPDGVLGEVRIHQKIYAMRPDAGGICRIMPSNTMALSTLGRVPRPRHGVGAFIAGCKFWDDPRLLRNDDLAQQLAARLANEVALVMRGNGAVTVGSSIESAMCLAWCLEDSAKIERYVSELADATEESLLAEHEVSARQVSSGRVFERLWEYLTAGDPEPLDEKLAFPSESGSA